MPGNPWIKRAYDPADEAGVLYLHLKSFAHSPFGRAQGAHIDGSDGERAYWKAHREVVLGLLASADTEVLCDPEEPSVFWAFAITRGDLVHYAVVKRRFRGESASMFRDLLGERLDRPCTYTHDFAGTGLTVPASWILNPYASSK